jgi:predicted membrane metal-binding protein
MSRNFHERFLRSDITAPSERSTGLVFAIVAAIVALLWRNNPTVPLLSLCIALALAAISLFAPSLLRPFNILWFKLGLLLNRVMNPVVMFLIFALVFVPAGMILRIWRDPLKSRRESAASSYWIDRKKTSDTASSMINQF